MEYLTLKRSARYISDRYAIKNLNGTQPGRNYFSLRWHKACILWLEMTYSVLYYPADTI